MFTKKSIMVLTIEAFLEDVDSENIKATTRTVFL